MISKNIRLVESRTKLLYAKILEKIQSNFPDIVQTEKWKKVRVDILNLSNDIIRANQDDFCAFEGGYKIYPFVLSYNARGHKTMSLSNAALNIFQNIKFDNTPYRLEIKVSANDYNIEVIEHILKMLVFGEIKYSGGFVSYVVYENDCIRITSILNIIPFRSSIKKQYEAWKKDLSDWYFAHGDWHER